MLVPECSGDSRVVASPKCQSGTYISAARYRGSGRARSRTDRRVADPIPAWTKRDKCRLAGLAGQCEWLIGVLGAGDGLPAPPSRGRSRAARSF